MLLDLGLDHLLDWCLHGSHLQRLNPEVMRVLNIGTHLGLVDHIVLTDRQLIRLQVLVLHRLTPVVLRAVFLEALFREHAATFTAAPSAVFHRLSRAVADGVVRSVQPA